MGLISLCTLEPVASVAAIRFPRPVRIRAVRIIPSSSSSFPSVTDFTPCTEPESFPLELFFNWQPSQSQSEKPKASNLLLHTALQYAGQLCEYEVDTTEQLTTRLLIVKGPFTSMTLAIYGEILSSSGATEPVVVTPTASYEPCPLPQISLTSLPSSLDPSSYLDPFVISQRLIFSSSDTPDIIHLIRRCFAFPPLRGEYEGSLDQLLVSYEVGENWIRELLELLEAPIDESDLPVEVVNGLGERMLETLAQSPSSESLARLFVLLARHSSVMIDCLMPPLLSSGLMAAVLSNSSYVDDASLNPQMCDYLRDAGVIQHSDFALSSVALTNAYAWDSVKDGHPDFDWILDNLWNPGFLPSVLEYLSSIEGDAVIPASLRLRIAVAGVVSVFIWAKGSGAASGKARAVLELWLTEDSLAEVVHEVITKSVVTVHLQTEFGKDLLDHLHSRFPVPLETHDQNENGSRIMGNGSLSADSHPLTSNLTRGDLDAASECIRSASIHWSNREPIKLESSIQTVRLYLGREDGLFIVTRAFWRQGASAAQTFVELFVEACQELREQNWSLDDSSPSRKLVRLIHGILHVLHYELPEHGVTPALVPVLIRTALSLLVSVRQPTYATRSSAEQEVWKDCQLLVADLTDVDPDGEFILAGADAVLPTLLNESLRWDDGVDPLSRASAAADLIVSLLEVENMSHAQRRIWAKRVIGFLPNFHSLISALEPLKGSVFLQALGEIDDGEFEIADWLILERVEQMKQDVMLLSGETDTLADAGLVWVQRRVEDSLQFCTPVLNGRLSTYLEESHPMALALVDAMWAIWDRPIACAVGLSEKLLLEEALEPRLKAVAATLLLRACSMKETAKSALDLLPTIAQWVGDLDTSTVVHPQRVLLAVGAVLSHLADNEEMNEQWQRAEAAIEAASFLLQWALDMCSASEEQSDTEVAVSTLSQGAASRVTDLVEMLLTPEKAANVISILKRLSLPSTPSEFPSQSPIPDLQASSLPDLVRYEGERDPSTPLLRPVDGVFGIKTSTSSARNSSPVASLAKTYTRNDFRELRTQPGATRLNTSRPPSRHVDDFEQVGASSDAVPAAIPPFGAGQLPAAGGPFYVNF